MSYDPFVLPIQLSGVQPGGAVTQAMADEANAHTLQALIELIYVRTGNQILSSGLTELDEALRITEQSIETLTTLQQLHNSVEVESLSAFGFDYQTTFSSPALYQQAYNRWASAYFGLPIFPNFLFESQGVADLGLERGSYDNFNDFASQLAAAKATLSANIGALELISPESISNPNSLLNKLKTVYKDLPPVSGGLVSYNDAKVWALDSYTANEGVDLAQSSFVFAANGVTNIIGSGGITLVFPQFSVSGDRQNYLGHPLNPLQRIEVSPGVFTIVPANIIMSSYLGSPTERGDASKAGMIQQNIQFAVTAAQSLNDSQKERVRRYLFVFEEFYKSASTLLSRITQIIEKIAQGIRPA